jgi:hypothetical protein
VATGRNGWANRCRAALLCGLLGAAACGRSGPGNGLVPAHPSATELTVYVAIPARGRAPATHLPTSVVTIEEPAIAGALGLALDGLPRTPVRCPPSDPFIQAIFFSTPPHGHMIATIVNIDTRCGTVSRPIHSRLYRAFRETPAVAAEIGRLLAGASPVDRGPGYGVGPPPTLPASGGASGPAAPPGSSGPAAPPAGRGA